MRSINPCSMPELDLSWIDDYYEGRSRGRSAYFDARLALDDNPFDPDEQPFTHRGWRDGWLQALHTDLDRRTDPCWGS